MIDLKAKIMSGDLNISYSEALLLAMQMDPNGAKIYSNLQFCEKRIQKKKRRSIKICKGVNVKEKIKGSGEWWVFVCRHGKRYSKNLLGETAAIEFGLKVKNEIENGSFDNQNIFARYRNKNKKTFDTVFYELLESIESNLKLRSYQEYISLYNRHINPFFGESKLCDVKPDDILLLLKSKKTYSESRIRFIKQMIIRIYRYAKEKKYINYFPIITFNNHKHEGEMVISKKRYAHML